MKFHFPLTKQQNDFYGRIFDAILKYYPIGVKGDDPAYDKFPGQIELGDIVIDSIHNRKNYKSRWSDFNKEIRVESKKKTEAVTGAFRPSFSSNLILSKHKHQDLIHFKKLHYSVSLVGPFFTIYGFDETIITDERRQYASINIVTVSPYKEFEADFNFLKSKIEKKFKGYTFIPFTLNFMLIDGLYDPYNNNEEYTIYRSLFDDYLKEYNPLLKRGDSSYGFDRWVIYDMGAVVTLGPPPQ
ncbi:hypothetical protein [Mucilaginibacter sp.]|uniref:hypothetical protein n=1 Tax=Mucilaginibacter sp. TaxID=1882438 RepID=UPI003D12D7D8